MIPNNPMITLYKATVGSNIAFIKYWGKRDALKQWPANDSLSMTLKNTVTTTLARVLSQATEDCIEINGQKLPATDAAFIKAKNHLDYLRSTLKFVEHLEVSSSNNFPSDCGIASSASGFAALTIASIAAWTKSSDLDQLNQNDFCAARLADLSRMGSGSAGRSVMGGYVNWIAGENPESQKITVEANSNHWKLSDLILVLSSDKKSVGSTDAHKAAWTSLLYEPRLAQLNDRLKAVKSAIQSQSLQDLGPLIEAEALEMHAVIMTATPAVTYMIKETAAMLAWIRNQRNSGEFPAWFTLDAGPNIHLICESKNAATIVQKIRAEFDGITIIEDRVGEGPSLETVNTQQSEDGI